MTDTHNPDARHDQDIDHDLGARLDRQAPAARYPYRDPGAASPDWTDAFARRYRLTQAGERYLHFTGAYNDGPLVIDHDRCFTGGCAYQTEAENRDEFEAWNHAQDREPDTGDREAEL
jgi:hypothetical protein